MVCDKEIDTGTMMYRIINAKQSGADQDGGPAPLNC